MISSELITDFRKKIFSGESVYGPFMKTKDAMFVEIAGIAGFDFAILDMEHGPISLQDQQNNIRAALLRDMLPIIRINELTENAVGAALDIGACGIQVPQITNAEQAAQVVEYAKFYPKGMRGVCRFVRAADYSGMPREEYFKSANDTLLIIQLEGKKAIDNIDDILSIQGIDIIFIGPYDLSQSLGVPGQVNDVSVINEMKYIVECARQRGKIIGTFVDTLDNLNLWRNTGIRYLSYNTDAGLFMETCKKIFSEMKNNES